MDPLFWILAGIVVGCVIGIVVLWRLEARAERRLAIQRQIADRESAMLKAIDPLVVIEETDTGPIPMTPEPSPQQATSQKAATARPAPASEMTAPTHQPSRQPRRARESISELGTAPLPGIQVLQQPIEPAGQVQSAPSNGKHPASTASAAPATTRPLPNQEALTAEAANPAAPPAPLAGELPAVQAPTSAGREIGGTSAASAQEGTRSAERSSAQELLQTTPERARLRATELAREQRALEEMLEANRARLEELLRRSDSSNAEQATTISLLRSEMVQQRERLLEMIFLEQSYRQIAAGVTTPPAQPPPAAPANTPRAFGVRRHPLARVEPPGQDQPAPDTQATLESSS